MKNRNEKCCGSCCWFYGEDTEGCGLCADCPAGYNILHCDSKACGKHISKEKVRHSAAVLAQFKRISNVPIRGWDKMRKPEGSEIDDAIGIIIRYVNVITKKL